MELTIEEVFRRGDQAYKEGNINEADKLFTAVLEAFPDHPLANYKLGIMAVEIGRASKAISLLQMATEVDGSKLEFWLNYIDLLIKLGLRRDAKDALSQAKKNGHSGSNIEILDEKLSELSKAKSKSKQDVPLFENQKKFLLELYHQNKFEKVLDAANQLKEDFPTSIFLLNLMGAASSSIGKFDNAVSFFREALRIKPDFAEGWNNLGSSFQLKKQLDEAVGCYRKALKIQPNYVEAIYNMGNVFLEKGELDEAIGFYREALKLKPDYVDAYNNMGNAQQDLGNMIEAKHCYKKTLEINPKYAEALYNLHSTSDQISEARDYLKRCLEINGNHLKAKLTLAALEVFEGREEFYNAFLDSDFKDHHFVRSIKWYLSLQNKPKVYFNRWNFFRDVIKYSDQSRPFYEFGVWRGEAFKYLIKFFGKGYGFDTFEGLPEKWHDTDSGTYSGDGRVPSIKGGEFVVGKFEDTLPEFFLKKRPMASLINFDADLYSSTKCALDQSYSVIDKKTVLIFDEFINNKNWELDEYKALNDFCIENSYDYTVLAVSFFTKQVAIKLKKRP